MAAVAALFLLIWGHSIEQSPAWPMGSLRIVEVLVALGLIAGRLPTGHLGAAASIRQRVVPGLAQPVMTTVALVVLIVGLSDTPGISPAWPLWTVGLLLCLGLVAEPFAHLAGGRAVHGSAQSVAAVAALFMLILALSIEQWPLWPMGSLRAIAVLVGLGLIAGGLAEGRVARRLAQPTTTIAALIVLLVGLQDTYGVRPTWPLWTVGLLLCLGLVAEPLAHLASGRAVRRSAQSVAAVVSFFLLIVELSTSQWPVWPMGTLRTVAVLAGIGLIAGRFPSGQAGVAALIGERVRSFVQPLATAAALFVLVLGLSDTVGISRTWPLWTMVLLLGLSLIAERLPQLASRPREKVLSERIDELWRTRRGALDVQASELRRIERDLHDGAQVRLVALSMKLGRAEDRYRDHAELGALLREAREDAAAAIRELRELARGIAPPVLTDRGLEAAVRSLAQRSGADVTVSGVLERRPLPAVETAAYFVIAESLTNAAKHAPGSRVEVRLDERGGDLIVEITDFGPGGANPAGGGLTGLRQRAEALDGSLHVTSPAGVGTQVEAVLPCGR